MVSKKKRSKQQGQVKGVGTAPVVKNSSSSASAATVSSPVAESIAATPEKGCCNCKACVKGYAIAGSDSDSPFLRLPREVRNKIYQELLISRLPPKEQAQYEQVKAAAETPFDDFGRENALDYFEQGLAIMPGADEKHRYRFIVQALGLLLANKQIHAEANEILFSQNIFVVLPEWERIHPFWRCEGGCTEPRGKPCWVKLHNIAQIKHLYIIVNNACQLGDPMLKVESARLAANIKTVVEWFKVTGNKFKTLKIRYSSAFEGQIEAVRDAIEGPQGPDGFERPIMLADKYGKYWQFGRKEAQAKLFIHCNILAPLMELKGVAEDVKVRGDIPQKMIDDMTATLSSTDVSPPTKKKKAEEAAEKQARPKKPDQQDFWREMRDKYMAKGDQGMVDMAEKMMSTSVMSPAVMEMLMAPPTREELMGYGPTPPPPPPTYQTGLVTEVSDDEDEDDGEDDSLATEALAGSIGMLNGKPVFGPPRPPQ
ncbi:hypothetical protein LTR56_015950 [Elasticomyces elasticus]|nr:hypothetical protein LTR56_015950 [Elasticomyces elasticus]KAK3655293.1 hypothetical protein LTR22_010323 [Elasticomyces elasticus]KAK4918649.1 hypothetical protein LTR49_013574 [Elasticomyces elasticus]KAK5751941.1 hypothetical protein LTS12_017957 [Elasticomyces elasticus]